MQTSKRAYSTKEAALYVGFSETMLKQSRMTGPRAKRIDAPQYTRLGCRKIVYLKEDLDAWLDHHKDETVSNGVGA